MHMLSYIFYGVWNDLIIVFGFLLLKASNAYHEWECVDPIRRQAGEWWSWQLLLMSFGWDVGLWSSTYHQSYNSGETGDAVIMTARNDHIDSMQLILWSLEVYSHLHVPV